jgi:hypothetical protein
VKNTFLISVLASWCFLLCKLTNVLESYIIWTCLMLYGIIWHCNYLYPDTVGVKGSNPFAPTRKNKGLRVSTVAPFFCTLLVKLEFTDEFKI